MKCKNVAHFVKVCKKREKYTSRPKKGHNVKPPKMTISPLPSKLSRWDVPTVDIELGGVRLERVIDRATWEILKKKKKKKKKKAKCISRTSNRKLYSYGSNEPLTTAGEFESELCYKDKRFSECFIVVEDKTRAILSKETTEELAIVKLEINTLKEKSSLRDFPSVLME